jgi:hypothetical protein
MYRLLRTIAVLAVAGLLVVAAAVPAASAGSADRPLKGWIAGGGTVVPDASCPLGIRTVMWGSGEVTHLGWTTMTGTHCTPPDLNIVGGVQTFVAANGDTLEMTHMATVARRSSSPRARRWIVWQTIVVEAPGLTARAVACGPCGIVVHGAHGVTFSRREISADGATPSGRYRTGGTPLRTLSIVPGAGVASTLDGDPDTSGIRALESCRARQETACETSALLLSS